MRAGASSLQIEVYNYTVRLSPAVLCTGIGKVEFPLVPPPPPPLAHLHDCLSYSLCQGSERNLCMTPLPRCCCDFDAESGQI